MTGHRDLLKSKEKQGFGIEYKMAGAPKGNRNAAKTNRMFTDALRRVLTQSPEKVQKLAEKLTEWAEEGQQWAFQELVNRLEGKPHQSMEIAHRDVPAEEIDDAELLDIATGGRKGASKAPKGKANDSSLH